MNSIRFSSLVLCIMLQFSLVAGFSALAASDLNKESIINKLNQIEVQIQEIRNQIAGDSRSAPVDNQSTSSAAPLPSDPASESPSQAEKDDYNHALNALKEGDYTTAELLFTEFMRRYPNSNLQSNVHFWHAETFFKQELYEKAALNYLAGYKKYPTGVKAADSLLKLAISLGALEKFDDACKIIHKLENEFPSRPAMSNKRSNEIKIKFGCKLP